MHTRVGEARDLALNASFEACSLIAEIMQNLDSDNSMEPSTAERLLQRLRDWSSSLPNHVRQFTKSTDLPLTILDQEQVIGNIHIACVYYFAVMLVTRPFLISHLMANLPGGGPETLETTTATKHQSEVVNLAQACIDSAMFMAQMCHDALQPGLLLNNMCLMK